MMKIRFGVGGPWVARLSIDGKRHFLGSFKTPEEAAHAYDTAAKKFYGEFCRLNFEEVA